MKNKKTGYPPAKARVYRTSAAQRKTNRERQFRLRAAKLCICCGKRKSHYGRGSTTLRCPVCAEKIRVAARSRYRVAHDIPVDAALKKPGRPRTKAATHKKN